MNNNAHRRRLGLLTLLFATPLLAQLPACGGGGGSDSPAPAPTPSTPTPPPPPGVPSLATPVRLEFNGPVVGTPYWQGASTSTGGQGQALAGMTCGAINENALGLHIHPHLSIFLDGQQLAIPANIGVTPARAGQAACTYALHTHDGTGIIHVESTNVQRYTLGQFFEIWGRPLSRTDVAGLTGKPIVFWLDNGTTVQEYTGDPTQIELVANLGITIQVGTALSVIPTYTH